MKRLLITVLCLITLPAFAGKLEWVAAKKAARVSRLDVVIKWEAYLANPTPGTLNVWLNARAKFKDDRIKARVEREKMKGKK